MRDGTKIGKEPRPRGRPREFITSEVLDRVRDVFLAHHADLLDPAFWQGCKDRILAGHVHDVFPYEPARRFAVRRQNEALEPVKELTHG